MLSEKFESLKWLTGASQQMEKIHSLRHSNVSQAGDRRRQVGVILSGWAFRYHILRDGRRQILQIMLPGDAFGLESIFQSSIPTSIQASSSITFLSLHSDGISLALNGSADFQTNVLRYIYEDNMRLQNMVISLGKHDGEERVVSLLLDLYDRLLMCDLVVDRAFTLELTQSEVADLIGVHAIHFNRILIKLRNKHLISVDRKRITLINRDGMKELASESLNPLFVDDALPSTIFCRSTEAAC